MYSLCAYIVAVLWNRSVELGRGSLIQGRSATLGEEFVEKLDIAVSNLGEDPFQRGLRKNIVELGGFDESEGDHRGFSVYLQGAAPLIPYIGQRLCGLKPDSNFLIFRIFWAVTNSPFQSPPFAWTDYQHFYGLISGAGI